MRSFKIFCCGFQARCCPCASIHLATVLLEFFPDGLIAEPTGNFEHIWFCWKLWVSDAVKFTPDMMRML